jgi:integrase
MTISSDPDAGSGMTLETLLRRLETDLLELPLNRRKEFAAGIRTIARVLGRPPAAIPADPVLLGPLLNSVRPARVGLGKQTFMTAKSRLRRLQRQLGLAKIPARNCKPVDPDWLNLVDGVEQRKHRLPLMRLLRWLSAEGIRPQTVTRNDLLRFQTVLGTMMLGQPQIRWHQVARAWNHAAATIPGWPAITLPCPALRDPYSLVLAAMPPGLQADIRAYLAQLTPREITVDDLFRPRARRTLRPASLKMTQRKLEELAGAAVRVGVSSKALTSLTALCAPDTVEAAIRFLYQRNGQRKTSNLYKLAYTVFLAARDTNALTATDLEKLRVMRDALAPETKGMAAKVAERLRQFEDPRNLDQLLELPFVLMRRAQANPDASKAPRLALLACVIELGLATLLRVGNIAGLRLDTHVSWPRGTGKRYIRLEIPGEQVKNGETLDKLLTGNSAEIVNRYVAQFRSRLCPAESPWLFPDAKGGPISVHTLTERIKCTVERETGLAFHTHLFRAIGGQFYIDARPGDLETVRQNLGHRTTATTALYYIANASASAVRQYHAVLEAARARPAPRPRKRKSAP